MDRAYSVLKIKSLDAAKRIIRGIATTPQTDRVGDIVEPLGATFAESLPLLLQHDHAKPVGTVKLSKPTATGIEFTAEIAEIAEPGALKDRVDEAWQSIKAGLITAVSIGFRALEDGAKPIHGGGWRFTSYEVMELSLVTIPANADAAIQMIRSADQKQTRRRAPLRVVKIRPRSLENRYDR